MSLNDAERRHTAAELRQALDRSGLGLDEVAADLSMTRDRVTRVLNVAGAEPVHVWQLRDYLQQAIATRGSRPCGSPC